MRREIVAGHKVVFYNSIEELPIINFQKYNKYLLSDAGVGSDVDSIDVRISRQAKYIEMGDTKSALTELENLRAALFSVANEISPRNMAFVSLIYSIDGRRVTDYSDENMQAIFKLLNTEKQSVLQRILEGFKKKIDGELLSYFPKLMDSSKEKEVCGKLKIRTLLVLEGVTEGKDNAETITEIDESLLRLSRPKRFTGRSSFETEYDRQFESMCLMITQKTNQNARNMTVLQYYNAIAMIEEQLREEQKAYKRK